MASLLCDLGSVFLRERHCRLRNTGNPLEVTGLVIRYEISVNGNAVSWAFHYLSTAQPYVTFPDLASPDTPPIIAPGGSIIIVPFHNLNDARMITETRGGNKTDFLNSADVVTISVDSVIRSDGTISGPDRSLQFAFFQREISDYTEFEITYCNSSQRARRSPTKCMPSAGVRTSNLSERPTGRSDVRRQGSCAGKKLLGNWQGIARREKAGRHQRRSY